MRRFIGALRKYWFIVIAAGVIGGAGTFTVSAFQTPEYQSTATLYFALDSGGNGSDLNQGSTYTQDQMLSFAQLAVSSRVLNVVIDELDLDMSPRELERSVQVSIPPSTVIMQITVTSTNPERSAEIANAVATSLSSAVPEIAPKGADGEASISAQAIDDAVVPGSQSSPNKMRDGLFGGIAGGLIGVAGALILSIFDNRIRNESTLTNLVDAPALGTVTRANVLSRPGLGVVREPLGPTSEEFRRIGSALAYAGINHRFEKLMVTSAQPGEGKSTVAANLAFTLADLRGRVLLIDCDLRRPSAHRLVGIDGTVGLTDVLVGDVTLADATYHVPDEGLDVLPAGGVAPNPAEILVSPAMISLLHEVADQYDLVVLDSPPVLSVADANLLAPIVDGVLIVVDSAKTRRAALVRTVKMLSGSGARIVGTLLNKSKSDKNHQEYYTTNR